jgi:hypothetical protein
MMGGRNKEGREERNGGVIRGGKGKEGYGEQQVYGKRERDGLKKRNARENMSSQLEEEMRARGWKKGGRNGVRMKRIKKNK